MTSKCLINLTMASMAPGGPPYGLIPRAAIAMDRGIVRYCGPAADLPPDLSNLPVEDCGGRLVTPGLIDCHTHVVFGGTRAREFEMRQQGASYEQIAQAGGGIMSTVTATRAVSEDALLADALTRVDAMIAEGVCTIEVKSGYGLTLVDELKLLRVATRIALERPIHVHRSFLGAHAVPPDYAGRADAYLDEICLPALESARSEGLVDSVDGFCEGIAFSPDQIARMFDRAQALGLPVRLHAEQLSNLGGAALAARYGALSVDHLEYLDTDGVAAMAAAGTIAVLLPGAFYTLHEVQAPPVPLLRAADVPMAVATDCNPGTSPLASPLLAMNMAATLFGLTPEEALAGTTRNAAAALGRADIGRIAPGLRADLAIWDVTHPAELTYRIGFNPLHRRIFGGER
ncbi:imidazolonepropionase [Actibacterium sp. D379-3]